MDKISESKYSHFLFLDIQSIFIPAETLCQYRQTLAKLLRQNSAKSVPAKSYKVSRKVSMAKIRKWKGNKAAACMPVRLTARAKK